MGLLHLILNLAALLLWVHWRIGPPMQQTTRRRTTGAGLTQLLLRKARSSISLLLLLGLLAGRGWFYYAVAPDLDWQPRMSLVIFSLGNLQDMSLPFDHNVFEKQLAFSFISFLPWLVVFNFCILVLSVLRPDIKEAEGWNRFLRAQLGWLDWLPAILKIPIGLIAATGLFYGAALWLQRIIILPGELDTPFELAHFAADTTAIHLWHVSWFVMGLITLYYLNSYIYFGGHNFWKTLEATGKSLLWPLNLLPLRWGKLDLAPVIGIALTYGVSILLTPEWMAWIYQRLT